MDVEFDVLYCGICHSDLHTARSEWSGTTYPCVPGHELLGRVTRVGAKVTRFAVGDITAVGCMVDSCGTCANCSEGTEQYCDNGGVIWTYNTSDPQMPGHPTYGGYSTHVVVNEKFCFRIAPGADPAATAPLLCAGVTTYSPLRHWGAGPSSNVGVVGLGGLGHMATKLSHALGAHTTVFTSSSSKMQDARRLGADEVASSVDTDALKAFGPRFDLIIDTVSVPHDLDAYLSLLKRDGALVLVGVPEHAHPSPSAGKLITKRRRLAGSLIGGTVETQEMLDFCAARGIGANVEVISADRINEAYERMLRGDVRYRFVIDTRTLLTNQK